MVPLYDRPDGVGYGRLSSGGVWLTWQPHFEPLLMNALAEDIFARVGPIDTLADFADELRGTANLF